MKIILIMIPVFLLAACSSKFLGKRFDQTFLSPAQKETVEGAAEAAVHSRAVSGESKDKEVTLPEKEKVEENTGWW